MDLMFLMFRTVVKFHRKVLDLGRFLLLLKGGSHEAPPLFFLRNKKNLGLGPWSKLVLIARLILHYCLNKPLYKYGKI